MYKSCTWDFAFPPKRQKGEKIDNHNTNRYILVQIYFNFKYVSLCPDQKRVDSNIHYMSTATL